MTTVTTTTRPLTFLLVLLALQKVSSFAPSPRASHHHHHQRTSIRNVIPPPNLHTSSQCKTTPPSFTTSTSTTRLYSAAAERPSGHNLRQLDKVNGSVLPKGTIPLSTNQGIGFGCLLAWTSGMINGATLMGLWSHSQGTAALTGTYTKSAIFLAKGDMVQFAYYLTCLLTWAAGSLLVGLLVPEPSPVEVKHPRGMAASLVLGAVAVSTASLLGFANSISGKSFILLCLLANGIQDAISSGGGWRTTHLTGITCDIGMFLGHLLRGRKINQIKLKGFSLLALSFWVGAFLSVPLSGIFGSRYLLGVAGAYLSMAASIGIYFLRQRLDW